MSEYGGNKLSSGFRLCGASITGTLVRPTGVGKGDFVEYCEAVENTVCEEASMFTVVASTQRTYVTNGFYTPKGEKVLVEFKDGELYDPQITFVPARHTDPLIAKWVLENYELPVDRWRFTIFTNTPEGLGKVWVTFEELTQF